MASWTESRGQSLSSIRDLLALRNQRKQSNADRATSTIMTGANMAQDAQQKEAERQARMAEIEARGGQDRATEGARYEPFEGGPRMVTDPATGREIPLNSMADYTLAGNMFQGIRQDVEVDAQTALQEANNEARADLQGQMDDAAMDRLDTSIQAELDAATRQFERRSEDYSERQSFTSQTTGKTYTWQTQEEFELVKGQIEQDNYIEAQKVIAGLRGADPDSASKIREAYEFAKMEILWDAQSQTFRNLADMSDEDLMSTFMDAVDFYKLSEEEANTAYRLFTAFMDRNPIEPPPPRADGDGRKSGVTTMADARDAVIDEVVPSPTGPRTLPELIASIGNWNQIPNRAEDAPEGVEGGLFRNEEKLWNALTRLASDMQASDGDSGQLSMDSQYNRIMGYISDLEMPGKSQNYGTIEQYLKDMFAQAGMLNER